MREIFKGLLLAFFIGLGVVFLALLQIWFDLDYFETNLIYDSFRMFVGFLEGI